MRRHLSIVVCLVTTALWLPVLVSCSVTPEASSEVPEKEPEYVLKGGEYLEALPPSGTPLQLAFDRNNVLWVALSYRGGIVACRDGNYQVFDRLNAPIPDGFVRNVFVDNDNTKWFGAEHGYVYTFDDRDWETLPTPAGDYRWSKEGDLEGTYRIRCILQDSDGVVWVAARYGGVWSYKDKRIDSDLSQELGVSHVQSLALDTQGHLLIAAERDVYSYNGQSLSKITHQILGDQRLHVYTLFFDHTSDVLYVGTNHGLIVKGDEEVKTLTSENSGLAFDRVSFVERDQKGNLWIAYWNGPNVLTKYDGLHWTHYPVEGGHVRDVVYNSIDDAWSVASADGVSRFDGESWSKLPVLDKDPRLWWRQKSLGDLAQEETIPVSIHYVLKYPLAYGGKKISFTGKVESGWEYADIIDEYGFDLDIWPERHPDLPRIPMASKPDSHPGYDGKESEYWELVGYLEFQGYYGHLGSWPFQLFITEVRPLDEELVP